MLERYLRAASGDLDFVRDLLRDHPRALNLGWDGSGSIVSNYANALGATFNGLNVSLILLINPVVGFAVLPMEYYVVRRYDDYYRANHIGWTLLEFAASKGQSDVAVYLILSGADTNNQFIKIAKENGYDGKFVTLCTKAIEVRAKMTRLKNDNKLIQNELDSERELVTQLSDHLLALDDAPVIQSPNVSRLGLFSTVDSKQDDDQLDVSSEIRAKA